MLVARDRSREEGGGRENEGRPSRVRGREAESEQRQRVMLVNLDATFVGNMFPRRAHRLRDLELGNSLSQSWGHNWNNTTAHESGNLPTSLGYTSGSGLHGVLSC